MKLKQLILKSAIAAKQYKKVFTSANSFYTLADNSFRIKG